jgi:HEAT repeat protein
MGPGCLAFVGAALAVAAVPATAVPSPVLPRAAQGSATSEPPQDIGPLLKRLKDPDPSVRGRTADELNRISDPAAVPALLAALMAADRHDRQLVAGFLEKFKDPRKIEPYVALLRQCGWECYELAKQLAELGEAALRHLLAASSEPCGEEPDWLARALAEFGEPALQPLLAVAKSDNPCQRLRAVSALGSVGYDSEAGAREYALVWQAVIAGLGDPARPVRLAALDRVSQLTRYLEQIDAPPGLLDSALPLLATMLKTEEDQSVCRAVVAAMVQIGGEEVTPALRATLQGEHEHASEAARAALDSLIPPPPSHHPGQVALRNLRSPNPKLRAQAAAFFGSSADSSNTPHLVALLGDGNALVRAAAGAALGELNAPATQHNDERERDTSCVPHLIALLKDREAGVRKAAVDSLTAILDPAAVLPITARLNDPTPAVRAAAANALGQFADPHMARAAPARRSESAKALMAAPRDGARRRRLQRSGQRHPGPRHPR